MPSDSENPKQAREQRILDAAMELIAHYGYDKTTMDDIAREAGVSKGALYLHFKSKDDLFETLLLRESEGLAGLLLERVENDPQGGTLFGIYKHSLLALAENKLLRALYTEDRRVLGDYMVKLRDTPMHTEGFSFGAEFVRNMQASGLIRTDIPAETITYLLIVIRYGLLRVGEAFDVKETPPLEAIGVLIAEMLDQTLSPQGGDVEAGKAAFRRLMEFGKRILEERRAQAKRGT